MSKQKPEKHAELCKVLFGEDWDKCISEYGRNKLYERYILGEIPDIKEWEE
jgi:hypothetical protein